MTFLKDNVNIDWHSFSLLKMSRDTLDLKRNVKWNLSNIHTGHYMYEKSPKSVVGGRGGYWIHYIFQKRYSCSCHVAKAALPRTMKSLRCPQTSGFSVGEEAKAKAALVLVLLVGDAEAIKCFRCSHCIGSAIALALLLCWSALLRPPISRLVGTGFLC
jgi:hypothetical protein